jgi:hypothetical protein
MMQNILLFLTFNLIFFWSSIDAQIFHFKTIHNNQLQNEINSSFVSRNNLNKIILPVNDPLPENPVIESGLIFEKESEYRQEDNSYSDKIQLLNLSAKAQAIQFRLLVNKSEDDSTILIFQNLQKGSAISDTTWVLDYNIFRGPIDSNGASKDEVYVLLYNIFLNGGLPPGDYHELLKVNYTVVDLPDIKDSVKSSMKITNAQASTSLGQPIDITPSRDEFKIYARVPVLLPDYGLIFESDTVYRLEDDSYTEMMQLIGLPYKVQAMQFKLLVNKVIDDNIILTFQSLQKSDDLSDPSWVLDYNVVRGPITPNGASVDEIYVLIYNLFQNNGLPAGDYYKFLEVKYRVADLPALEDSIKSSIKIINAEASTYQGFPVNITPSRSELTVIARNRIGYYGDVNSDGCLDVLDVIMIVDHIIARDSLRGEEFLRADLAPWVHGNPAPFPDGFVNVQDLSLLQNIILSGIYPDGTPINGCSYTILPKVGGDDDVISTVYINNEGITIYINPPVDIRGVQIEFGNVADNPDEMVITTDLGHGYYKFLDENLRVLLYDRLGQKIIPAGKHLLADIPFLISRPEDITVDKFLLIDVNRNRIIETEVEIIYGNPPTLPQDYILYQNYPNPFNPATTIEYSLPKKSYVTLKVYDILGNEVAYLVNEEKNRGNYLINFNSAGLASGVYFYRLQADEFVQTKKMMLLR